MKLYMTGHEHVTF